MQIYLRPAPCHHTRRGLHLVLSISYCSPDSNPFGLPVFWPSWILCYKPIMALGKDNATIDYRANVTHVSSIIYGQITLHAPRVLHFSAFHLPRKQHSTPTAGLMGLYSACTHLQNINVWALCKHKKLYMSMCIISACKPAIVSPYISAL